MTARSIPHRCPVCNGRGELTEEFAKHATPVKYDLGEHKIYCCHGCDGTGIVWEYVEVEEKEDNNIPTINLPPTIINPNIIPQIPSIPKTTGIDDTGKNPWGVTWDKLVMNPGWTLTTNNPNQIVSDHICGSFTNPPELCGFCMDMKRYDGADCSCSPEGMPHSMDCKGYKSGPCYEDFDGK